MHIQNVLNSDKIHIIFVQQVGQQDVISTTTHSSSNNTTDYTVLYDFISQNVSEITLKVGTRVTVLRKCDKSGNSEWWLVEHAGRKGYIPESFLDKDADHQQKKSSSASSSRKSSLIPGTETVSSSSSSSLNQTPLTPLTNSTTTTSTTSKFYTSDNGNTTNSTTTTSQENVSKSLFYDTSASHTTTTVNDNHYSMDDQPELEGLYANQTQLQSTVSNDTETTTTGGEIVYILEYDFEALNAGELGAKEGQIVNCLIMHDQKGNPEWWLVEYDGQQGYIPRDYLSPVDASQMC